MDTEFEYVPDELDDGTDREDIVLIHTKCGSTNIEANEFASFGGTTEGYTKCLDCGHTESWADLNAVI